MFPSALTIGVCWIGLASLTAALAAEPCEVEPDDEAADELALDDEFALLEEETVVFSAARREQPISESPASITVIERDQIEHTHCLDVACLMRQVPELEVRDVRAFYQAVGARALTGELNDRGLVLVDGREVNLDAYGLPFWAALPVHLEDIERIEVVRGPGSALYGANAHSMVVVITTRVAEVDRAEVFVGAAERDLASLNLRVGKVFGDWRMQIQGGLETAGGWTQPQTREKLLGRIRALAIKDWGAAGVSRLDLGLIGADGDIYTELAPAEQRDVLVAHALVGHVAEHFEARLWGSLQQADMHLDLPLEIPINGRVQPLGTFPEVIDSLSSSLDADGFFHHSLFAGNRSLIGANYRWLTYISEANNPRHIDQHRVGIYAQLEQRLWDVLMLTLGARFDYNSLTPPTVSPRGAVVWRFLPDHLLRVSAGQAFRKPSFFNTSVHIVGVEGSAVAPRLGEFFERNIGNEDLDNESVTTVELGYRAGWPAQGLSLEATGYFGRYQDSISFDFDLRYNALGFPDLTTSRFQFVNDDYEIYALGGSLGLTWKPIPPLRVSGCYSYHHAWFVDGVPPGAIPDPDGRVRFQSEPEHIGSLAATYQAESGLSAGATIYARSGYVQRLSSDGSVFGERISASIPPGLIASAHVSWRLELAAGWLEVGLRAFNLFQQPFRDTVHVVRYDGVDTGGDLIGRRVGVFLRGSL